MVQIFIPDCIENRQTMNRLPSYPIFYDPRQHRKVVFRRLVKIASTILLVLLGIFLSGILHHPSLPSLNLGDKDNQAADSIAASDVLERGETPEGTSKQTSPQELLTPAGSKKEEQLVLSTRQAETIAFYVNWDDTSFSALQQHIAQIDKLMPEWLHLDLDRVDGSLVIDNPEKQEETLDYIQQNRPQLKIVPLINNYDSKNATWEREKLAQILADGDLRKNTIDELLEFVQSNHFAGINIDFEYLEPEVQPHLLLFMQELHDRFAPLKLEVSQSLPLVDKNYDYRQLAEVNDYLILMAYNEHATPQRAGAIASQNWYTEHLQQRLAELPAHKYVVAIGNYGYDWQGKNISNLTFQAATQTARKFSQDIKFDRGSLNSTFEYDDELHLHHQIWFLDAVSGFNQVAAANKLDVRRFALWRLGSEDPSIWEVFDRSGQLDRAVANALNVVPYGYEVAHYGKGELLKVTAAPTTGKRKIVYDAASGSIVDRQYIRYPTPYEVEHWGNKNKRKIALTFDDGPDPEYTSQVLDILKQYQVPGTFFVIGMNAQNNLNLLHRIVDEGHELGSHTYTHPNISLASAEEVKLELNTTQRLFESHLGLRSLLFRPPYAVDISPNTTEHIAPLALTSSLGYYTAAMHIDPHDWSKPGVDKIVTDTIAQAINGKGNVVLLHDGGGDRSQTVAALPKMIRGLRDRGFELVTMSDLVDLDRSAVMPALTPAEQALTIPMAIVFSFFGGFNSLVYYVILFGLGMSILRLLAISLLSCYQKFQERQIPCPPDYEPLVTVVVAAFNEDKTIDKTIRSLLKSDYPNVEIVVVDDGSKDITYYRVMEEFGDNPQVHLFSKANGGKGAALNYGIQNCNGEIVVIIDADTIIHPNGIGKLVRHFTNYRVAAVAGNAKVGNRVNLLTSLQSIEYITSQNLERRAFSVLNAICVVPGAIGAWRRQYLLKAGGFSNDTLAEDGDLTVTLLKMGYIITSEQSAIARTEAPETLRDLIKQRFRWMYGSLQVVWKHRDALFRPQYGVLGMVVLPNNLFFQILFAFLSPIMDGWMVVSLAWTLWHKHQHPEESLSNTLLFFITYILVFMALDFLTGIIAFLLEPEEDWKQLIWLFPQRFFYRPLMYYVSLKAIASAIQGQMVGWGKLERKASVIEGGKEHQVLAPARSSVRGN